jgi:triple functional domain protein
METIVIDYRRLNNLLNIHCNGENALTLIATISYVIFFQGKITAQGKLILQDSLLVAEQSGQTRSDKVQFHERRVFLFEQIIIFSEEISDKKRSNLSSPEYVFKQSIKVCIVVDNLPNLQVHPRNYQLHILKFEYTVDILVYRRLERVTIMSR